MPFVTNRDDLRNKLHGVWDATTGVTGVRASYMGWACAALIGLGLLLVYASMLPAYPTRANYGGDGGDFMAAMLTGGIPHPTGYPAYTLFGRLFLLLPQSSTPYWRVALLSAVAGSTAAALAFAWVRPAAGWLAALAAALAWGSSPLFWSQAVIVEVHALQAVFVMAWLGWISALLAVSVPGMSQQMRTDPKSWLAPEKLAAPKKLVAPWILLVYALTAGISLGNHLTILLLLPALGAGQYLALRRGMPVRWLLLQAVGFVLGGLVYLYLPWQARSWPPVNWGNPQNLNGLWWLVSAAPYRELVFGVSAGQWLARATVWAQQLVSQFSLAGVLLGALGLLKGAGLRIDMHLSDNTRLPGEMRLLLVWVFAIYSLFSLGYDSYDSAVYLIPAYLAFAVWLGQGVQALWPLTWSGWPVGRMLGIAMLVLLLARMPHTSALVNPRPAGGQADFTQALLSQAPPDAILLTAGDADGFPLWYAHFGLGQRPDVHVVVQPLTKFQWYQETLHKTYPELAVPPFAERQDGGWADELVGLNPARPVCRSFEDPQSAGQLSFTCQGAP